MEWHKLRTVRSTWYIVAVFAVSLIGLAVLALSHEGYAQMSAADRAAFDPTHDCFIGLGARPVAGRHARRARDHDRVLLRDDPRHLRGGRRRPLVLAAKAAVLGAVTLAAGEISAFAAFFAGQAVLPAPAPPATLGQPGVLRAVLLAGAYPALIALIGLGLGALIRHTAGAICAVVGVLFVLPLLFISPSLQNAAQNFLPHPMVNSLTAVKPLPTPCRPG